MDIELKQQLDKFQTQCQEAIENIQAEIKKLKDNSRYYVRMSKRITPGMAAKVMYNENGMITGTAELAGTDIPEIDMSKVSGLEAVLLSISEKIEQSKIPVSTLRADPIIAGTSCKVNYDAEGRIVSGSELLVTDIPHLPLDHIDGLRELLELRGTECGYTSTTHTSVKSGTYTKVTVDTNGHVVNGGALLIDDMPRELINQVNRFESRLTECAKQKSIDHLTQMMQKKLDASTPIEPGTFTKVTVDSNGIVRRGSALTLADLPKLTPHDIDGLVVMLKNKADHGEFLKLAATVNSMVESISKINEVARMRTIIDAKADKADVESIRNDLTRMKRNVEQLLQDPNEELMKELRALRTEISSIGGRLSVVETRLGIES